MIQYLIVTVIIVIILITIMFKVKAFSSRQGCSKGLIENKLQVCLSRTNCVCSEYNKDSSVYMEPLQMSGNENEIEKIRNIVQQMNGEVINQNSYYLSATFKSKWFGFIDDFEVRLDVKSELIQYRSESRVGRSDFGVNRKRLERFCELYNS